MFKKVEENNHFPEERRKAFLKAQKESLREIKQYLK